MAKKRSFFEFVVNGYTPDTLPMERLAQYLLDLSALLGEKEHVHFEQVREGSASLRHWVDEELAILKVREHVAAAKVIGSPSPERRAFESLDAKLREDRTSGELVARDEEEGVGRLLYFPGRNHDSTSDPVYGPFSEPGSLQGRIIAVGGKSTMANVNIQHGDGQVYYCESTRDMATELGALIYRVDVRVFGMGRYIRTDDGKWEMRNFRISHYEKLDQRSLSDVVGRLRAITRKVGLDKDILHKLEDLRKDPSEA